MDGEMLIRELQMPNPLFSSDGILKLVPFRTDVQMCRGIKTVNGILVG
jgi:hypothetical protein